MVACVMAAAISSQRKQAHTDEILSWTQFSKKVTEPGLKQIPDSTSSALSLNPHLLSMGKDLMVSSLPLLRPLPHFSLSLLELPLIKEAGFLGCQSCGGIHG